MAKKTFKIKVVLERSYETDDDTLESLSEAFDVAPLGACLDMMFDAAAEMDVQIEEVV